MRHPPALLPAFALFACARLACALLPTAARAQAAVGIAPLPDTFAARVEALASMASLDAAILASRSATATLEAWCASHAMAEPPRIAAQRIAGPERPPSDEQRRRLEVGPDDPVRHRRVRLACGDRVLSEADNWYVPARLTPAMNAALDATDTPFGKVVAPLQPVRQTLAASAPWPVLPPGWELRPPPADHPERPLAVPRILFEHAALLLDGERRPIALVEEHYTRALLEFARARRGDTIR